VTLPARIFYFEGSFHAPAVESNVSVRWLCMR